MFEPFFMQEVYGNEPNSIETDEAFGDESMERIVLEDDFDDTPINPLLLDDVNSPKAQPAAAAAAPATQTMERLELDDVDQLVAQEMTKLSLTEREKVLQDVHAIPENHHAEETSPELRSKRLTEFQQAIDFQIPVDKKSAYLLACRTDSSYVEDERFRVRFLRADFWDPYNAAVRFMKYFELKLELFRQDLLCREIQQDDLDQGTLEVLYGGFIQELPLRDRAGRVVILSIPSPNDGLVIQKQRRIFYATMIRTQDEETQLKGRVVVHWVKQQNNESGMDRTAARELMRLFAALPSRVAAIHTCIQGKKKGFLFGYVLAMVAFTAEKLTRLRMKSHFGTPKELKAALNAYGIPGVLLPISDDGEVINEHDNLIWTKRRLEERQNKRSINNLGHTADTPFSQNHEQLQDDQVAPLESFEFFTSAIPDTEHSMDGSLSSSSHPFCDSVEATTTPDCTRAETSSPFAISTPGNNDVLLGRGRLGQWHMGNIQFRNLIESKQSEYDGATKVEKIAMAAELVRLVQSRNGKFLKEEGSVWSQVPDNIARRKVANCFRTTRHRKKKIANNSNTAG